MPDANTADGQSTHGPRAAKAIVPGQIPAQAPLRSRISANCEDRPQAPHGEEPRMVPRPQRSAGTSGSRVVAGRENGPVELARVAWLATVLACLIAVAILVLQGYYGYAGVTLAVAASAAINLK